MSDVLVLNSDGMPISLVPVSVMDWQETVRAVYLGHVEIIHLYDDWFVHSPSTTMQMPAVVMTRDWIGRGRSLKFCRNNVFLRDNYTCQYCAEVFLKRELTLDHVVPRARGGTTRWDNVVAACGDCNHGKGMKHRAPKHMPYKPTYGQLVDLAKRHPLEIRHESWNFYIGWPESKVKLVTKQH